MGGFTIVSPGDPPPIARFEPAVPCWVGVVTPKIEVPTREAREALPSEVPLQDAVANVARASSLVLALLQGDERLLRSSLADRLAEPYRARFIPGFAEAKKEALAAGAFGCSISGAGPSVFALTPNRDVAKHAADAIAAVFVAQGLGVSIITTTISPQGARRI